MPPLRRLLYTIFFSLVLTSPRPSVRSRRRAYTQGQMTGGGGGGGGGSAALWLFFTDSNVYGNISICVRHYTCVSHPTRYTLRTYYYIHTYTRVVRYKVFPPLYVWAMCLYVRDRIRLARDADSIFIIIIIFNTSRTGSRIIYYVIMRSAVGIVLAILYYNENVYWQRAACRSDDFWATTPAEHRSANCERRRDE